ncbi:hypothetical protein CHARACLAT_028675 [Characodon lateralis]|uniref:Uncharacterized protein n=1 Tax=Characodon lateralis TaxID=208331 RepID=A0ABU7D3F2_9TELE|nr:hypothetical protein [Characodon lateralis]
MSMIDVSLANILLSPTTSTESSGQPRTELVLLTSMFSLFLSRSVLPGVLEVLYPQNLATLELFDHLGHFGLDDEQVQLRVPSLCFHQGRHDGRIEEILKVLLPLSDNVPRQGQQLPTPNPTINSVGKALLTSPEALDGFPESL